MRSKIYSFLLASLAGVAMLGQTNLNVTLADQLVYTGQSLSNIWYYVDEFNNEYALVGAQNGISIVNVTNPANVVQVCQLTGPSCSWREIKTVGNYAYISSECGNGGLQIVDLNPLPTAPTMANVVNWTPTIMSTTMTTIHALHAEAGRLYLYGSDVGNGGVIVADVSTTPMAPVYLGNYNASYVHDGYVRNNKCYAGHIYDGWFSIMDVSNPASIPTSFPTQSTPGNFTHNTWLASGNDDTIYTTDEVGGSYLTSYDISNPGNIQELDRIQSQNPGSGSIVHNTHILNVNGNDYAVTSWYKDGIVITDCGRPNNLVNVGWYDTYTQGAGGGFAGCWGVNPFLPSGTIVVSDINNGLFVLSPTYIRACYLEGLITDFSTSAPINNATVTITTPNITDNSDATGFYGTGYATAGTYSVTYSKAGYISQTVSVTLTNGVVTIQNIQLVPLATIAITGQVIQTWNSAGIPNAFVRIWNGTFTFDTITDINGNFTIPSGYAGTYTVMAGKWLYVTNCISNQNITQISPPIVIPLDSGIYDDFSFDFAWTVSGTASAGIWERGEPLGTTYNTANDANPDVDVTADCYVNAYVTGNTGMSSSDDDVDGGYTMLSSPIFSLVGYQFPKLQYSRWFFNNGGSGSPNDSLRVRITNGSTTVTLELVVPANPQSVWVNRTYYLNSFLPSTANMRIMVRAVDFPMGHLVEGGFDHFRITDSITIGGTESLENGNQLVIYPNPSGDNATLLYAMNQAPDGHFIRITDVSGRIVKEILLDAVSGEFSIGHGLSAGTYFVELRDRAGSMLKPVKMIRN